MDGIRGVSGERVGEGINLGRFYSPKNEGPLESGSAVSPLEREQVDKSFPGGSDGKESACIVGDLGSIPGLGGSPEERERLLAPVFWPREFHRLYSRWGCKESDTTE